MSKKVKQRCNGEGSIYYSEKLNRWVAQYTVGVKQNGSINRKSVYSKTRKEVSKKLTEALNSVQTGKYIQKSSITLIEIIKNICEKKLMANIISEGHYARMKYTIKSIEKGNIANIPIQELKSYQIQEFLNNNINYSDSCIKKLYQLINQACKNAIDNDYINKNPMNNVIKPKSVKLTKKVEALTIDEQRILSKYLFNSKIEKERYKNVFLIQMYMGLRISEALALNKNNIDFENKILYVNKTLTRDSNFKVIMGKHTKTYAGTRELPIPDILIPIFQEQINAVDNEENLLFYNNGYIANTTMTLILKRIMKSLKLRSVGTHVLRHTYATRSIEGGISAVVLQRLMGHTDIKITLNTYASVFNKFKEDELVKVNNYLTALKLH